jgi:hypothetical protein
MVMLQETKIFKTMPIKDWLKFGHSKYPKEFRWEPFNE